MSKLYVCKAYETPTFEGFEIVSSIEDHDARVRAETIDECIEIVSRETHDGTLCDYLEELKVQKDD